MLTVFNVSSLAFIKGEAEKNVLRFLPSKSLDKNLNYSELIKRIFTEDILTSDEDLPEIIKQLINAGATNEDDIREFLMAYPYQNCSAIFDNKYLNWSKIGTGRINWTEQYKWWWIDEAAVQYNNIAPNINTYGITIETKIRIQPSEDQTYTILVLFSNLDTSTTAYSKYTITFRQTNKFNLARRITNSSGSTATSATFTDPDKIYRPTLIADLKIEILPGGEATLEIISDGHYNKGTISGTTTFNPKNIRVFANAVSSQPTYFNNLDIRKFKIIYRDEIISQWKGEI